MPAKKTIAHKGKPKRLTVAQRRAILVKHGWVPTPPYPDVYWRGAPSMQRVRVKTGEVSDNGGETYTKLTDRDFRAFVRKHAPTASKGKTAKPTKKPRMTLASLAAQFNDVLVGPAHNPNAGLLSRVADLEYILIGNAKPFDKYPEGCAMARLATLESRNADTDRKAASLEALRDFEAEWRDNCAATTLALNEVKRRLAALEKPAPATPAVDVVGLVTTHGLKWDGLGHWEGPTNAGYAADDHRRWWRLRVNAYGHWKYGAPHVLSQDSGSIDTLAAALERYCPVADAQVVHFNEVDYEPRPEQVVATERILESTSPYGEAERRADAIAAGWVEWKGGGAFYPRSIPCNTEYEERFYTMPAVLVTGEIRHAGREYSPATPAEFRAHLAKYAVRRNGPASLDLSQSKAWREAEAAVADKVAAIRRMNPPSGLVMEAPPREPDATPDERRRECERRGLVPNNSYPNMYTRDGNIKSYPRAWINHGCVYHNENLVGTPTRTLAEFTAAMDAVGLVAKAATAEERAKLCEAWGMEPIGGPLATNFVADEFPQHGRLSVNIYNGEVNEVAMGDGRLTRTTTLADLKAVFRKHLPYDREWREKVAREHGWKETANPGWWSSGAGTYPFVKPHDGITSNDRHGKPLPDRAAWLAFIRDNTPEADPLDAPLTREAFDAECKGRGGKPEEMPYLYRYHFAPSLVAVFHGDKPDLKRGYLRGEPFDTLRELRAVLDANLPPLVGDGPWTVEQLNAAGIECHETEGRVWYRFPNCMVTRTGDVGYHGVSILDRRRLLHAANDPDASPDWSARVKKALGIAQD